MNLNFIRSAVEKLCKANATFLQSEAASFSTSDIEYKGLNNLVSYVDQEMERRLVAGLQAIVPGAGFITEEGTIAQLKDTDQYYWLVDPLDGTANFVHKVPQYSISIALAKGKEVLVGVVFDPNRSECFSASKGNGAFLNQKPIQCSSAKTLQESMLATGFPYYSFEKMPQYLSIVTELMKSSHGLRRMGSAAIDMCWVACGRFEAYFEYNIQPYDIAAGMIILSEAGGISTDFAGNLDCVFAQQIIAGNAHIHPLLKTLIEEHWN